MDKRLRLRHQAAIIVCGLIWCAGMPFTELARAVADYARDVWSRYRSGLRELGEYWERAGMTQEEVDAREMERIRRTFPPIEREEVCDA